MWLPGLRGMSCKCPTGWALQQPGPLLTASWKATALARNGHWRLEAGTNLSMYAVTGPARDALVSCERPTGWAVQQPYPVRTASLKPCALAMQPRKCLASGADPHTAHALLEAVVFFPASFAWQRVLCATARMWQRVAGETGQSVRGLVGPTAVVAPPPWDTGLLTLLPLLLPLLFYLQ